MGKINKKFSNTSFVFTNFSLILHINFPHGIFPQYKTQDNYEDIDKKRPYALASAARGGMR